MSAAGWTPARLHVVTDDEVLAREGWLMVAHAVLEAGGDDVALHLRGPRARGRDLHDLGRALLAAGADVRSRIVVNDRVDVALALGLERAQLGARSLEPAHARRLLGARARLGVSCHDVGGVRAAARDGADWVFAGTVYSTPSHPGRSGIGPHGLGALAAVSDVPVMAIGGIDVGRVADTMAAGAYGVAVLRGIWDAERPAEAVSRYLSALWKRP